MQSPFIFETPYLKGFCEEDDISQEADVAATVWIRRSKLVTWAKA